MWHGRFDGDGRPLHRKRTAYQVTYEALIGIRPADMEPHHLCENKQCVNPWHLEWLTHADHARLHGDLKWKRNVRCPANHEYTPENTYEYTRKDGRRERHCLKCRRDRWRELNGTTGRVNKTKHNPKGEP